MNPTLPFDAEALLLADAGPLAAGVLLVGAGLLTVALFFLRREPGQLFLLAFGLFSLLYGLRLLSETATLHLLLGLSREAMTQLRAWLSYVLPITAFLSFEQFLGAGWRSSQRRVWQVFALFAVAGIAADAVTGVPESAMRVNNVLVIAGVLVTFTNAFRRDLLATPGVRVFLGGFAVFGLLALNANLVGLGWLPWSVDLEVVGFLLLVCSLAWAGAQRFFANERQLASIESELETARRIQTSILPRRMPEVAGLRIAARYVPMSSVAGDFYDFLEVDGRRLGVLVADVSGHGVPAALIASMVKVAVAAQAGHAGEPEVVLERMNRIFLGQLERQFVTAAYVFVDLERRVLIHASGGHPSPLLWRRATGAVEELPGGGPLLGRFHDASFASSRVAIDSGDRIVLYTDGLTEAAGAGGEPYGDARLAASVAAHAELPPEGHADALLEDLARWTGGSAGASLGDDLTLVVLETRDPAFL